MGLGCREPVLGNGDQWPGGSARGQWRRKWLQVGRLSGGSDSRPGLQHPRQELMSPPHGSLGKAHCACPWERERHGAHSRPQNLRMRSTWGGSRPRGGSKPEVSTCGFGGRAVDTSCPAEWAPLSRAPTCTGPTPAAAERPCHHRRPRGHEGDATGRGHHPAYPSRTMGHGGFQSRGRGFTCCPESPNDLSQAHASPAPP